MVAIAFPVLATGAINPSIRGEAFNIDPMGPNTHRLEIFEILDDGRDITCLLRSNILLRLLVHPLLHLLNTLRTEDLGNAGLVVLEGAVHRRICGKETRVAPRLNGVTRDNQGATASGEKDGLTVGEEKVLGDLGAENSLGRDLDLTVWDGLASDGRPGLEMGFDVLVLARCGGLNSR